MQKSLSHVKGNITEHFSHPSIFKSLRNAECKKHTVKRTRHRQLNIEVWQQIEAISTGKEMACFTEIVKRSALKTQWKINVNKSLKTHFDKRIFIFFIPCA